MWSICETSKDFEETISNAFNCRGILKIRPEDQVDSYPKVEATVQNKKMVIGVDKSLTLLEEEMVAKCSSLGFDANIDTIVISSSGNLIICGLVNGEIHGIYIKGLLLFNVSVKREDVNIHGNTFAGIQQIGLKYYVLCTNGSFYCLGDIDESALGDVNMSQLENETINCDKALLDSVVINRLKKGQSINYLVSAFFEPVKEFDPSIIACGGNSVYFDYATDNVAKVDLPARFEGVKKFFYLHNYILVLTNSGHVLEICRMTKTICYSNVQMTNEELFEDMLIMDANSETLELLMLTKHRPNEERQIKFVDYPAWKCTNQLDVLNHSWLVRQPKSSVNLFYIGASKETENHLPNEIEMFLVSETDPADRFKKLIARGHFEEAEKYGLEFELPLQPLCEAKAKKLITEISSLNEDQLDLLDKLFAKLLHLLKSIENPEFFRNNRMINIRSRKLLERYLKEMLKHLDEETDEDHIFDVTEQLHRLKTLAIIDPYETNADWQKFVYHSHIIKMVGSLLKTDIKTACLIWKRHYSSIISRLNVKELHLILSLIPANTDPFDLILWLRNFVPTISGSHPNVLPYVMEWSMQKTRGLQYSKHWPEIGVDFSTNVMEIFEDIKFFYSDITCQYERNISKLHDLVNALQDLTVLKTSYGLHLTLDNYLQDSIEDTALCILQHVHLNNLKSLVNDFLYPIFQEKGSTPVAAIRRYIQFLVANRNSLSQWLERAVICIELFHSEEDRLVTALLVLKNSPVPWPASVAPLIKFRTSTHRLALEINAEYDKQVIKIMKVKYGWPIDRSYSLSLMTRFLHRIFKLDLPDMLEDINILKKAVPDISQVVDYNYCYEMAKKGRIEDALLYYENIFDENNDCKHIRDFIADILENSLSSRDEKSLEQEQNLIDFYKIITVNSSESERKRYQIIQNRFNLHQNLHLSIASVKNMSSLEQRLELFEIGLKTIIERSQASANVVKFLTHEINDLCQSLELEKAFGLLRVCQTTKVLQLTCALAYDLLQDNKCNAKNQEYIIDFALELIIQAIQTFKKIKNTKLVALNENDPLPFPLIYELLCLAFTAEEKYLQDLIEFICYVLVASLSYPLDAIDNYYCGREQEINQLICKALDEADIHLNDSTLNYSSLNASFDTSVKPVKKRYSVSIFDQVEIKSHQNVAKIMMSEKLHISRFVATAILLLVIETEPTNEFLLKLKQALPEDMLNEKENAHEVFFSSLEHLIKAKSHDVWYKMAKFLLNYQVQNQSTNIINSDFVSLQLKRVFKYSLMHKDVDFLGIFSMLISDNYAPALMKQLENDIKTEQQRANFLCLSEMYMTYVDNLTNYDNLRLKRLKYHYYLEFCKQDPSIKSKFNPDLDNIEILIKEFHNKKIDIKILEQMSRDFGYDYQKILVTQIISILQGQELQYDIKTDAFGDEELVVRTTVDSLKKLCEPYLNEINNTELLTSKLKLFIDEINIYFYEMYLCVIELLMMFDAALSEMGIWSSILKFLKHKMTTKRRNRPGQLEADMWLQSQKEIGVLPKIARYRLPFKPIVEQPLKDILESELNVDNVQSWFPLIKMHTALKGSKDMMAQNCDYFCMSAVKNSIAEYKATNESETWNLQPINNPFLQAVLRVVEQVHNPSKAFLMLYFVSNYAPYGADQVEASYECYKYALAKEAQLTDPKYTENLAKIKRKYPILKTQHLLHIYNLTDEKIMRLVESPADLIYYLYHHEIILKTSKLDINTVVEEIAKLHNLDIESMQCKLLHKFLSLNTDLADGTVCEETFLESHNLPVNQVEECGSPTENVIRANYILRSWPQKKAIQFLAANIFSDEKAGNTAMLLQSYECLSKLNDGSNLFDSMLNQRQYINIKCVHGLKKLGYNFSLEKFKDKNCNKITLLKSIWQRNAENPYSLEIMANICLGFEIYDPKIWKGILKRMVMANMMKELNALVEVLSSKPQFLYNEGIVLAWEFVLFEPFRVANVTKVEEQEEILHKILYRFQSCPVLHSLDLLKFVEICLNINRPHLAAVIMALSPNEQQREEMRTLILAKKHEKLQKDIMDLENAGILPTILDFAVKELLV